MKFKHLLVGFLLILFVLGTVGCSPREYTQQTVKACITRKHFNPPSSWTSVVSIGKTIVPITHTVPEEYNLYVEYKGLTLKIDNKDLYNNLEVGDSIKVTYTQEINKETGEVKDEYLSKI